MNVIHKRVSHFLSLLHNPLRSAPYLLSLYFEICEKTFAFLPYSPFFIKTTIFRGKK